MDVKIPSVQLDAETSSYIKGLKAEKRPPARDFRRNGGVVQDQADLDAIAKAAEKRQNRLTRRSTPTA